MSIFAYGNKAKCNGPLMEDSCYVGKIGQYVVLMVADGNGSTSGNVDSGVLVTTIASDWLSHVILKADGSEKDISMDDIGESLDSMMFGLSRCFVTMAALEEKYVSLFASLTVCVIEELSLEMITASIGNCELHRVHGGHDMILNNIHSEAYQEFKQGKLNEEEWRTSPKRGILTSAIGGFDEPTIDVFKTQLEPEDILYMTTDGLLHVTGPAGILDVLFENSDDIAKATDNVLKKAEDLECPDNCALVVGYVRDDVKGREESVNETNQGLNQGYRPVLNNDVNNAHGDIQQRQQSTQVSRRGAYSNESSQKQQQRPMYRRGGRRGNF